MQCTSWLTSEEQSGSDLGPIIGRSATRRAFTCKWVIFMDSFPSHVLSQQFYNDNINPVSYGCNITWRNPPDTQPTKLNLGFPLFQNCLCIQPITICLKLWQARRRVTCCRLLNVIFKLKFLHKIETIYKPRTLKCLVEKDIKSMVHVQICT